MNLKTFKLGAAIAAAVIGLNSPARADLQAKLTAIPVYQVGTGGFVSFGSVVSARTNLPSIWASASYQIDCSDPQVRPPLKGGRGWSDNQLFGPSSVTVTAPEWLPAIQELPGWQTVMGGTYVSCVYTTTGFAKTNVFPISGGGTTISIGGDQWEDTQSISFGVMKPGTSFGGGCIM